MDMTGLERPLGQLGISTGKNGWSLHDRTTGDYRLFLATSKDELFEIIVKLLLTRDEPVDDNAPKTPPARPFTGWDAARGQYVEEVEDAPAPKAKWSCGWIGKGCVRLYCRKTGPCDGYYGDPTVEIEIPTHAPVLGDADQIDVGGEDFAEGDDKAHDPDFDEVDEDPARAR